MARALSEATTGLWKLTSLGSNPWWKLLTVPAAIVSITILWLVVLSFMATIGLLIAGCYVIAAIVLTADPRSPIQVAPVVLSL